MHGGKKGEGGSHVYRRGMYAPDMREIWGTDEGEEEFEDSRYGSG